ncbi:hypothetical protein EG329_011474 [Mollisiaceae sp. DMI_Dod_QoI]|nr:hypothetical protein EG329_011474 [Helotiales sp. DMI_Dod_QoI]
MRLPILRLPALPPNSKPSSAVALLFIIIFLVFIVILFTGAGLAINDIRWVIIITGCASSLALLVCAVWNLYRQRALDYKSSLGNTFILVLSTIPLYTGLYAKLWYPLLNTDIVVSSTDSVNNIRWPSIAVFQRSDWSSQGDLIGNMSKCYLGWYNDTAPQCKTLDPKTFGNNTECTCHELWYNNDEVIDEFEWMGTTYRYMVFNSPPWFLCNTPTYLLSLQTFFNSLLDSSTTNPTLSIAAYDPTLGMQKAFETGYTRMSLINANGIVAVNLGLLYRHNGDGTAAYDYNLSLSSSPNQGIVCDTTSNSTYQYPCHTSLFIQVPSFDRTTLTTQKAMGWTDVIASAGSFFSITQFIAWFLSGQAFLP